MMCAQVWSDAGCHPHDHHNACVATPEGGRLEFQTTSCHANAQAALLAQKDSVTPLVVVLVTSSINLLGDYLLIAVWAAVRCTSTVEHMDAMCSVHEWRVRCCTVSHRTKQFAEAVG